MSSSRPKESQRKAKLEKRIWRNFFNPFIELLETREYRYARILRSSFWTKIKDTFSIFLGTEDYDREQAKNHLGLFDYLTLGIPYFISRVLSDKDDKHVNPGLDSSVSVFFLNTLPRYIASTVLTIVSSPLVLIGHAISRMIARKKIKKIQAICEANETTTDIEAVQVDFRKELGSNTQIGNRCCDNTGSGCPECYDSKPLPWHQNRHAKTEMKLTFNQQKLFFELNICDVANRYKFYRVKKQEVNEALTSYLPKELTNIVTDYHVEHAVIKPKKLRS